METRRFHILAKFIKEYGLQKGVEIGVQKGKTTFYLLAACPQLHLTAIDPWKPTTTPQTRPDGRKVDYSKWPHKRNEQYVREKGKVYSEAGRLQVIKGSSRDPKILQRFPDKSLDFVFIDGDHSYEGCLADIHNWGPKVKDGGFLFGHDIDWPEVQRAVREVFPGFLSHDNAVWSVRL